MNNNKNKNNPPKTQIRHNNGSRITNPGKIITKLKNYLDECQSSIKGTLTHSKYPTLAGFIYYLGFASSKELNEYCHVKGKSYERFLSRALLLLEDTLNQLMLERDRKNSNGIVRYMAAQFKGYSEKVDLKSDNAVKFIYFPNKLPVGAPLFDEKKSKEGKGKKND